MKVESITQRRKEARDKVSRPQNIKRELEFSIRYTAIDMLHHAFPASGDNTRTTNTQCLEI